jgi:hypothetical protein
VTRTESSPSPRRDVADIDPELVEAWKRSRMCPPDRRVSFITSYDELPAMPVVLGESGIAGTLVPVIAAPPETDVEADPGRHAVRRGATAPLDPTFESFPVLLHR